MSGAEAFPFPDDDPGDATTLSTRLTGWSTSVGTERGAVTRAGAAFATHWEGAAADLAAAEITAITTFATTVDTGLDDAATQLRAYATALEAARTTITTLRGEYDEQEARYDRQRRELQEDLADQGQLRNIALRELADGHQATLSGLHTRYDQAIADLDTEAATIGSALVEIAGRVSPDPESKNPEMARIGALDNLPYMAVPGQVSVVPTPNGLIVTGTDADDHVVVTRDPETGEYVLTINGRRYRVSEEQAEDMVIRTGDGSDVVDVDPTVQLGVTVSAGDGDDLVAGGAGQDTIAGGDDDDHLIGGEGNDAVAGGDGDDVAVDGIGLFGSAILAGRFGGRTVRARAGGGNDTVAGGDGDDRIDAGRGNDTVRGGEGNDRLGGGEGDDDIAGGDGDDEILGNEGDDRIDAGDGRDYVDAGEGDDDVDAGEGDDVVYGSTGNDDVDGGTGRDYLDGGAGDDRVDGGEGDDMVSGGEGDDLVVGGDGDDVVYTGPGDDTAVGGEGQDDVYAEHDDDVVTDSDDDVTRVEIDMGLVDEIHIDSDDPEFVARIRSDLVTMASSPAGNELLQALHDEGGGITITDDAPSEGAVGTYDGAGTITYRPEVMASSGGDRPPIATLYHEMVHAYNDTSGNHADGMYVGTNQDQLPDPTMDFDTDGDGVTDRTVVLDTDGDGVVEPDELDRDGDGDVDDDDMDLDDDGDVDRDDGWTPNTELQTVGIPHDHDGDPNTADVTGPDRFGYSDRLTENGFRQELRWPDRTVY